jgi:DNA processing protein
MKVKLITNNHSSFPTKLRNMHSKPSGLYVLGDVSPLDDQPVVSIVGSRAVTPYGRQITTQLAYELASRGVAIVSGLALGVDALAHQAAIEAGGYTAAVLPSAVDRPYPASNRNLARRILERGGGLISEYANDDRTNPAFKSNFIARNRIVAGLADVLLITEASEKSGTLHTANFALDQGKTVMAIPGNISSPNSRGTNNLIKAGALLVTDVSDVLEQLGLATNPTTRPKADNAHEATILDLLASGITDGAQIMEKSSMSPDVFNQTLTMLELSGKIRPLGAGHWAPK